MLRILWVVSVLAMLSGCMSHSLNMYGEIDVNEKSVTVPPGAKGLKGELKSYLAKEGWQLAVYRGPSISEGSLGEQTKIESYDTFNTRYRLMVASFQYDICFNFSPAINYEISFIDNKNGSEVFTIAGRGCESGVIQKFKEALSGEGSM